MRWCFKAATFLALCTLVGCKGSGPASLDGKWSIHWEDVNHVPGGADIAKKYNAMTLDLLADHSFAISWDDKKETGSWKLTDKTLKLSPVPYSGVPQTSVRPFIMSNYTFIVADDMRSMKSKSPGLGALTASR